MTGKRLISVVDGPSLSSQYRLPRGRALFPLVVGQRALVGSSICTHD